MSPYFRGGFGIRGRASSSNIIYSTNFPTIQNPISEGGKWLNGANDGLDWGNIKVTANGAVGTIATTFHDNTALLTGFTFPNDYYITTTAYINSPAEAGSPEFEHRLRSTLSSHVCNGYEVGYGLKPSDPYLIIVRWNGPVEDFTYLFLDHNSSYLPVNGDIITSKIEGFIISTYKNSELQASVDIRSVGDPVFNSGLPGFGTNADTGGGTGSLDLYGWRSFEVGRL